MEDELLLLNVRNEKLGLIIFSAILFAELIEIKPVCPLRQAQRTLVLDM